MATVSFKKPAAKTAEPSMAVATAPATSTAVAAPIQHSSQLQGEFTASDAALPYLNICQKSGTMIDEHADWLGQFVYDKSLALGQEITVVFARIRKYYEERVEYGSQEIPQRFETKAAADAAGCEYRDVGEVDLFIVTDDEQLADCAVHTSGDKAFVPTRMVARSTSYNTVVKILVKDLGQWLKGDLLSGYYTMTVEKRTNGSNSWFTPVLKTAGKVEPSLVAELHAKFGV